MNTYKNNTQTITLTAMLTVLTALATMFIKVPIGLGYIHLGDVFVVLAALMLPKKYAAFSAGVGASMADLLGGYAIWAPFTLFIKIVAVIIIAKGVEQRNASQTRDPEASPKTNYAFSKYELMGYAIAAIWSAAAYYLTELILYGNWFVPLAGIAFNIIQVVIGALIAPIIKRAVTKNA